MCAFCLSWLSFGVLLYFIIAVSGASTVAAVAVGFVLPPLPICLPIALLPRVSHFLLGFYFGFLCWLGFHTLFPDALTQSSPAGLYLLLALPSLACAVVSTLYLRAYSFLLLTPPIAAFLFFQGIVTFTHSGWAVLPALDDDSSCDWICFVAFSGGIVVAVTGVLLQASLWTSFIDQGAVEVEGEEKAGVGPSAAVKPAVAALPSEVALTEVEDGSGSVNSRSRGVAAAPVHLAVDAAPELSENEGGHFVLLPSSPVSAQHVVVVHDAPPVPPASFPTAPSELPTHPLASAAAAELVAASLPSARVYSTAPEMAVGAGARDEEEDDAAGEVKRREDGRRPFGTHVSVNDGGEGSAVIYNYDDTGLRYTQTRSISRPLRGTASNAMRTGQLGDSSGTLRPMYNTLPSRGAGGGAAAVTSYSTLSGLEPAQLIIHEVESRTGSREDERPVRPQSTVTAATAHANGGGELHPPVSTLAASRAAARSRP